MKNGSTAEAESRREFLTTASPTFSILSQSLEWSTEIFGETLDSDGIVSSHADNRRELIRAPPHSPIVQRALSLNVY